MGQLVALLAEGVDRNNSTNVALMQGQNVALLAEGVDRNLQGCHILLPPCVALLAEGVDRNHTQGNYHTAVSGRPPRGGRG